MKPLGTTGLIGRWKPLHLGGALLLETVCKYSDHVKIGIGSCNKYNLRNPFTADESREMIDQFLKPKYDHYEFILVPDFGQIAEYSDGQMWRKYVVDHYKTLDNFVSGNDYVTELLKDDYHIIKSYEMIPTEFQIPIKASMIRMAMARGLNYEEMLPDAVAEYIRDNKLAARFRREFGLEQLAVIGNSCWNVDEKRDQEKSHVQER